MKNGLFDEGYESTAVISEDKKYRYYLSRRWATEGKIIAFICLNPSTADADTDDHTVRKCIRYAKSWGGASLLLGNLFGYRATDPRQLKKAADPIGEENDVWLSRIADISDLIIAAWGLHGELRQRNVEVLAKFDGKLSALHLTKDGHPSHPLYLPRQLTPFKL